MIGGGLPVGAYGGKKEIMQMVAPAGPMYQVPLHTPPRRPRPLSRTQGSLRFASPRGGVWPLRRDGRASASRKGGGAGRRAQGREGGGGLWGGGAGRRGRCRATRWP